MTNKEAQRYIIEESCKRCKDYRCRNQECVGSTDCFEAKRLAVLALEKQAGPKITNKEVLQLFAKYEPALITECFDDMYCMGYNDCASDKNKLKHNSDIPARYDNTDLAIEWLESEYDTDLFREQDVDRLLEMQGQENDKQRSNRNN